MHDHAGDGVDDPREVGSISGPLSPSPMSTPVRVTVQDRVAQVRDADEDVTPGGVEEGRPGAAEGDAELRDRGAVAPRLVPPRLAVPGACAAGGQGDQQEDRTAIVGQASFVDGCGEARPTDLDAGRRHTTPDARVAAADPGLRVRREDRAHQPGAGAGHPDRPSGDERRATRASRDVSPDPEVAIPPSAAMVTVRSRPAPETWTEQGQDRTPESRALVDAYRAADYFQVAWDVGSEEDIRSLITSGQARAGMTIRPATARHCRPDVGSRSGSSSTAPTRRSPRPRSPRPPSSARRSRSS